jgi:segregation and condensation protein A
MQRIHRRLAAAERFPLLDLIEGGIHKSSLIGWFLATLELTRHHGAQVEQDQHGDIYIVRSANYSETLDVNEIDNYGGEEFKAAGMPGRPR